MEMVIVHYFTFVLSVFLLGIHQFWVFVWFILLTERSWMFNSVERHFY